MRDSGNREGPALVSGGEIAALALAVTVLGLLLWLTAPPPPAPKGLAAAPAPLTAPTMADSALATIETPSPAGDAATPVEASVLAPRGLSDRLVGFDARMAMAGASKGDPVFIRIFKETSELELWLRQGEGYALLKTYPICAYSGELGPKLKEGDGQAPEGFYFVTRGSLNPNSRFHLSFNLGFPNAYDRAHGRTGSFLMVHGNCVSIGCYAMTDPGIEEIYGLAEAALRGGQDFFQVQIFPFRMTERNLARHAESKWAPFWRNLVEGHALFERDRRPPIVTVEGKRYAFEPLGPNERIGVR